MASTLHLSAFLTAIPIYTLHLMLNTSSHGCLQVSVRIYTLLLPSVWMQGSSMLLPFLVLFSTVLHAASAHSSQLTHIQFTGKSILGGLGRPVSVSGFVTHACKPGEGHCSPVKHAQVEVFLQPGSVGRLHPHKPTQHAAAYPSAAFMQHPTRSLKAAPILTPDSTAAAAVAPATKLTATTDESGIFTVYVGSRVPGHSYVNASTTAAGQAVFAESLIHIRWTQGSTKAAHNTSSQVGMQGYGGTCGMLRV
jgi:hypothetical protein